MGEPIRIECGSPSEVAEPTNLTALTNSGRHVVLQFVSLSDTNKRALIDRLSAALPEHSVFNSGCDGKRTCVTVMPVVARSRVLNRRGQVLQAIELYRRACAALVETYEAGAFALEWRADVHGGHCRFENRQTGQLVEAPFAEWVNPDRIDPYFFAMFVRSTAGLEAVAELLTNDFHDADRVLEVIKEDAEPGATADGGS